MYEVINTIDAYLNSVHISGAEDALGRTKPFFNIVTAARNIWYRATDIDRKNIVFKVTKSSDVILTLVANILLRQWMKKSGFGMVLNDWGRALASYGSAVLKFVEQDGELKVLLIPWNRLIPDVIDFENNLKIEILELTPAQLRKNKSYDQDLVKKLLDNLQPREMVGGEKKDSKSNYIKLYEVHGEIPLPLLTDKQKDEDTYVQQMHVVSFTEKKEGKKGEYDDYTLYKGKEKQDLYFKTDLISEDGRTLGIGAPESLFESQWMVNHSVKLEKDVLDFASLMIMMTADKTLIGTNALRNLVTGDILIHEENKPLTQLNKQHDITQIISFGNMWKNVAQEITATPDSLRGDYAPSGTAWRQVEALRVEAHSLFEIMRENKGLAIEEMMRKFVIPFLKTKMDTADEIGAILSDAEVTQFDSIYVPNEARRINNTRIKQQILSGLIADNGDLEALQNQIRDGMSSLGNQRFLKPSDILNKTWKDLLKDFEWEVEVNPTEEDTDNEAFFATMNTMLKTAVNDPGLYKFLINKILERTGQVSPVEIPRSKPQQLSPALAAAGQNNMSNENSLFKNV